MRIDHVLAIGLIALGSLNAGCAVWPLTASQPAPHQATFVARGLSISGPDSLPPGWTTFHFVNESPMVHFAVLERMPEDHGLMAHQREVAPVFQQGMDLLNAGDAEAAMAAFGALPPWFGEIRFLGGPGFISPGGTAVTTVELQPGRYLLECYVKTGGRFHSVSADPAGIGMVHEFVVPDVAATETAPPTADLRVTVSAERGFEIDGELRAGQQTIAVSFADQKQHEHFLGHDVHLARVPDDSALDALNGWMNWVLPQGLETPAPVRFLGGVHEMPAGSVGYFTVNIEPGRYAFVAEMPDPAGRNMLRTVTVP